MGMPVVVRMKENHAILSCGCVAYYLEWIVWSGDIAHPAHYCLNHAESHYGEKFEIGR